MSRIDSFDSRFRFAALAEDPFAPGGPTEPGGPGGPTGPGGPAIPPRPPGSPAGVPFGPPPGLTAAQVRKWEADNGMTFDRMADKLNWWDPDATVDAKLGRLQESLLGRYHYYAAQMAAQPNEEMKAYYFDLVRAIAGDLQELNSWKGLSKDDKVELHNRIAHEAAIETKYNVALQTDQSILDNPAKFKSWTEFDLVEIDQALSKVPQDFLLRSDTFDIIEKESEIFGASGSRGGEWDDPNDTIHVLGGFSGTLLHELGHAEEPRPHPIFGNIRMREFEALSGWKRVGDWDDPRMARYNHQDRVKASELQRIQPPIPGLEGVDPNQYFQVSKMLGDLYIVPTDKPGVAVDKFTNSPFVSEGALFHPREDWAESFRMFIEDPTRMKKDFPQKYEFVKSIVDGSRPPWG